MSLVVILFYIMNVNVRKSVLSLGKCRKLYHKSLFWGFLTVFNRMIKIYYLSIFFKENEIKSNQSTSTDIAYSNNRFLWCCSL